MASEVITVKKAALSQVQGDLSEQVFDIFPRSLDLPYVRLRRASLLDRVQLNKTTELWQIGVTFSVIGDPFDVNQKTVNDLTDELDDALAATLDLSASGLEVKLQTIGGVEWNDIVDDMGNVLSEAEVTFLVEVV